jgi:hypothetical protein
MKRLLLAFLLTPLAAWADSPFDGTWVAQADTAVMPKKPFVISLDNGVYRSDGPVPPIKVKADGSDQAVSGHAYYDTMAVRVLGPDSIEVTLKKAGKVTSTASTTVSADGKTATVKWSDHTGTEAATGETILAREKGGPPGSNAVSGTWRAVKLQDLSANGQTVTYKATADGLSMSSPTGQSYEAKFDGKFYPMAGDPGQTMVSLKRVNATTIIETDKRLGKVAEVDTLTVSPDGKSMKVVWEDKLTGRTGQIQMVKSP